jgi:hypothetical protein
VGNLWENCSFLLNGCPSPPSAEPACAACSRHDVQPRLRPCRLPSRLAPQPLHRLDGVRARLVAGYASVPVSLQLCAHACSSSSSEEPGPSPRFAFGGWGVPRGWLDERRRELGSRPVLFTIRPRRVRKLDRAANRANQHAWPNLRTLRATSTPSRGGKSASAGPAAAGTSPRWRSSVIGSGGGSDDRRSPRRRGTDARGDQETLEREVIERSRELPVDAASRASCCRSAKARSSRRLS